LTSTSLRRSAASATTRRTVGYTPTNQPELKAQVHEKFQRLGLKLWTRSTCEPARPGAPSIAKAFNALAQLRRGLIRHLGVSNVPDVRLSEAQVIAPVAAVQNL
jgi:aryl-alcohol dehydrogenase-like predicted oxidoreductase